MREVPAPVAVVTVNVGGQSAGLTLDSLVSLSLEPPLVGIAVGRHAALHELLREAGSFAASGLWTGIDTQDGELGAPLLDGALAWIECTLAAEHPAGDHTFFVGEVVSARRGPAREALVHVGGGYE